MEDIKLRKNEDSESPVVSSTAESTSRGYGETVLALSRVFPVFFVSFCGEPLREMGAQDGVFGYHIHM
jgi:hypothetical protein